MMNATNSGGTALGETLAELTRVRIIPSAAPALEKTLHATGLALREAVLAEVPAYSASANPDILPELGLHGQAHMLEVLRLFRGGATGDFAFVRDHARHRAEQHFPLEAMLHAHRCGHRVVAHWLRDATLSLKPRDVEHAIATVADFAIEYTNIIGTLTASEYVAHVRRLADAESDHRSELLDILLSGYDESDGRVARLLKRAGYLEQRQSYCVVAAQSVSPTEMENPARAQRIIGALADVLIGSPVRMLAGTRNNVVVAVLSDRRRQSGWTAPQADLSQRLVTLLMALGPAVLVGASADHPSTSFLPKALGESLIALDFASVSSRVVCFPDLPIRDLLIHHGAAYVQSAAPAWAREFIEADARAEGSLTLTLRAIADAGMNVQEAARLLGKHANTVYARIDRIKAVTGLDARSYRDLTELLLAADCWRA